MPSIVHTFDWPDRVVVGTVGRPGSRAFYLQARDGARVTSVGLEKMQSAALAEKIDAKLPAELDVADGTVVDSQNLTFLDDKIAPWTDRVDSQWQKVVAVAKAMQDGAYTDGGAPGDYQNVFLPGHSLRRMTQFMKATQLAGNDEPSALATSTHAWTSLPLMTPAASGSAPSTTRAGTPRRLATSSKEAVR